MRFPQHARFNLREATLPDSAQRLLHRRPGDRPGAGLRLGLLPHLIGYHVRRAQMTVFQHFHTTMAPFDITPGQFGVLLLISENPGLSQSDLGAALGIDRSTMVAVIDRLESRQLVIRAPSPTDRRSYALRLSDEGSALLKQVIPQVEAHDRTIASALSAEEQAVLINLLCRVAGGTALMALGG